MALQLLIPDWPAPETVKAAVTLRRGGNSLPPFDESNMALHVGDQPELVIENRRQLAEALRLPREPLWLEQVHGVDIVSHSGTFSIVASDSTKADGSFSDTPGMVCAVMTADCLPVLLCNLAGTRVAAVHAGWRGLSVGILRKVVGLFGEEASQVMAYLGPAIGPEKFEVGEDVLAAFRVNARTQAHCQQINNAFKRGVKPGKYFADLYALAGFELRALGVKQIYGGAFCTFTDSERFYSYRRESKTGRHASLIWLE